MTARNLTIIAHGCPHADSRAGTTTCLLSALAEPGWLNVAEENDNHDWHASKQQNTQNVVPTRNGKMSNKPGADATRAPRCKSALTELSNHHAKGKEAEHGCHKHRHKDH